MANHVSTNVDLSRVSEEAQNYFYSLCEKNLKNWGNEFEYSLCHIFGIPEQEEDGPGFYSWNIDHMGSKWANIYDIEKDCFRITSAWDTPTTFLEWLSEQLSEIDPDAIITYTSEDEFPNWVSAGVYKSGGFYDGDTWDWDVIRDMCINEYPEIANGSEIDEHGDMELTEEGNDILNEVLWEMISTVQLDTIDEMVRQILEDDEQE